MAQLKDLTNKKFGRLTVLSKAKSKNKHTYWKCKCECGKIKVVRTDNLTSGLVTSCGCYMREVATRLASNLRYWTGKKKPPITEAHKKAISVKNSGRIRTLEERKRMSLAKGGNGSLEKDGYPVEWDHKLKSFIRKRDKYECRICGAKSHNGRMLDVHHIDYNKYNCSPDNLITLCKSCHSKTNVRRKYWKEYFSSIRSAT